MKKLILGLGLGLMLMTGMSTVTPLKSDGVKTSVESEDCRYGRCYAIAKSTGKRCKHCVSNYGDSYCWQHD